MDLGERTWTELDGGRPILVVPVGSCEQHGPHLPLATDSIVAEALSAALAARRRDCLVGPTIGVTASGEHAGFPGTLSIGTETTAAVLIELVRSADWARGVVLVNGHGGNVTALQRARDVFEHERRRVLVWSPQVPGGDPHAGHTETSLLLALAPDLVRTDRAVAGAVPPLVELVRHGVRALSETGVLGDPTAADAGHGADLLRRMVDDLADAVATWDGDAATTSDEP